MLRAIRLFVRMYRLTISPFLHWIGGPGSGCRFQPSCSQYLLDAVEMHGAGRGLWFGLKRIARCQPWGGSGYDPVGTDSAPGFRAANCSAE